MTPVLLSVEQVVDLHALCLQHTGGASGDHGVAAIAAALARVNSMVLYEEIDDIFSVAGMYVEALARGHVFVDANKRTALLTGLTYLSMQGVEVPPFAPLDELIVKVAEGKRDRTDVAIVLHALCLPTLLK